MNLLHLEGNTLTIKGATKIISSTPTQAAVETGEKAIVVTGTNIEVKSLNLDQGEVLFEGNFAIIKLEASVKKVPLLKRLFK